MNALTDDTGMLQHAIFTIPNRARRIYHRRQRAGPHLCCRNWASAGKTESGNPDWPFRYLAFLEHAFNPEKKRFRNFLGYNRRWKEEQGSEDSHGRALWALGTLLARSSNQGLRGATGRLFELSVPAVVEFHSPRACAYSLLGMQEYLACLSWRPGRPASATRTGSKTARYV